MVSFAASWRYHTNPEVWFKEFEELAVDHRTWLNYRNQAFLVLVSMALGFFVPGSSAAAPAHSPTQQSAERLCARQPAAGTSQRVLILVDGIDTSAESREDLVERWKGLTDKVKDIYSFFVYFSYDRETPDRYQKEDTFESIFGHHEPLLADYVRDCHQQGGMGIDIVGYSLGGVVSLEYIKEHGFTDHRGWVQHVITLGSPINGLDLVNTASLYTKAGYLINNKLLGSSAAKELEYMYAQENRYDFNKSSIENLYTRGVEVYTLSNGQDLFVLDKNSTISGFENIFNLGNYLLSINVFKDFSERVGHAQIMQMHKYPEVVKKLHAILYSVPKSSRLIEIVGSPVVLKPGERSSVVITIQNTSVMTWTIPMTMLINVDTPLVAGSKPNPLYLTPRAPNPLNPIDLAVRSYLSTEVPPGGLTKLKIPVKAPEFAGVYEGELRVAFEDVTFADPIPIRVVVAPAGSDAEFVEMLQAMVDEQSANAEKAWEDLRQRLVTYIFEESQRLAARFFEALLQLVARTFEELWREFLQPFVPCGMVPAALAMSLSYVWWYRRRP